MLRLEGVGSGFLSVDDGLLRSLARNLPFLELGFAVLCVFDRLLMLYFLYDNVDFVVQKNLLNLLLDVCLAHFQDAFDLP